jgi:hypothetical protein
VKCLVLYEWITTAPDADDDLIVNQEKIKEANYNRVLKKVACSGGTAAGDSVVEMYVGSALACRVTNGKTGDTIVDHTEYKDVGSVPIPAGKALVAKLVTDGGNNITLGLMVLP